MVESPPTELDGCVVAEVCESYRSQTGGCAAAEVGYVPLGSSDTLIGSEWYGCDTCKVRS